MGETRYGQMPEEQGEETVEHILECKDQMGIQHFQESVKHHNEWMIRADTAPDVRDRIKCALLSWKERRGL